jgi:predicted nucleic acid-binding protein
LSSPNCSCDAEDVPESSRAPIAVDTSILLNFLKAQRLDLLRACTARLVIPAEVRGEVRRPDQVVALDTALSGGWIVAETMTATAEVALFAQLATRGTLGIGERAVIAMAVSRGWGAALQDKPAREEALRRNKAVELHSTESFVREAIRHGVITYDEADALLVEWRTQHRFRSMLTTFRA